MVWLLANLPCLGQIHWPGRPWTDTSTTFHGQNPCSSLKIQSGLVMQFPKNTGCSSSPASHLCRGSFSQCPDPDTYPRWGAQLCLQMIQTPNSWFLNILFLLRFSPQGWVTHGARENTDNSWLQITQRTWEKHNFFLHTTVLYIILRIELFTWVYCNT